MLIKLNRFFLILLTVFLGSIYLPHYYWMIFQQNIRYPRILYSSVKKEFMFIRAVRNSASMHYQFIDEKGKEYERAEFEKLLPINYSRQLASLGLLPDSINGQSISLDKIRLGQRFMRVSPIKFNTPQIQLFPLFNTDPERMKLEMPDEFFRITIRMEIINAFSNKIDEARSRLFNNALINAGFQFPPRLIAGNPTAKKPYDAGYLILDAGGNLFRLRQFKRMPECSNTNLPPGLKISEIQINEQNQKEFFALLISETGDLFLMKNKNFELIRLPISNFKKNETSFFISGNIFYRLLILRTVTNIKAVVLDRKYQVLDTYEEAIPPARGEMPALAARCLFPFSTELVHRNTRYIVPRLNVSGFPGLTGILFFTTLHLLILNFRKRHWREAKYDLILILISGIFGFIAVHFFSAGDD